MGKKTLTITWYFLLDSNTCLGNKHVSQILMCLWFTICVQVWTQISRSGNWAWVPTFVTSSLVISYAAIVITIKNIKSHEWKLQIWIPSTWKFYLFIMSALIITITVLHPHKCIPSEFWRPSVQNVSHIGHIKVSAGPLFLSLQRSEEESILCLFQLLVSACNQFTDQKALACLTLSFKNLRTFPDFWPPKLYDNKSVLL